MLLGDDSMETILRGCVTVSLFLARADRKVSRFSDVDVIFWIHHGSQSKNIPHAWTKCWRIFFVLETNQTPRFAMDDISLESVDSNLPSWTQSSELEVSSSPEEDPCTTSNHSIINFNKFCLLSTMQFSFVSQSVRHNLTLTASRSAGHGAWQGPFGESGPLCATGMEEIGIRLGRSNHRGPVLSNV